MLRVNPKTLTPNPWHPRDRTSKEYKEKLQNLVTSIEETGRILEPIICLKLGNSTVIKNGHTRVEAALEIGMKKVPVIYIDGKEEDLDIDETVENLVQNSYTEQEKEKAVISIKTNHPKLSQAEIGKKLGRDQQWVSSVILSAEFRAKYVDTRNSVNYTLEDFHAISGISDEDKLILLRQKDSGQVKAEELRQIAQLIKKLQLAGDVESIEKWRKGYLKLGDLQFESTDEGKLTKKELEAQRKKELKHLAEIEEQERKEKEWDEQHKDDVPESSVVDEPKTTIFADYQNANKAIKGFVAAKKNTKEAFDDIVRTNPETRDFLRNCILSVLEQYQLIAQEYYGRIS